jgi:hypothetical protein
MLALILQQLPWNGSWQFWLNTQKFNKKKERKKEQVRRRTPLIVNRKGFFIIFI